MKKIILAALTVLMMFGLIGCSGDLHDYVDPVSTDMKGDWYYIDIPTDQKNIIFNCGDGTVQTDDIEGIDVSTGSVYYIFDVTLDKGKPGQCKVSDREDNPESKAGRVWVYSNVASSDEYDKIYCYNWGGAKDSKWPGDLATKKGETAAPPVVLEKVTISKVEVTGVPESIIEDLGTKGLFLAGSLQPTGNWTSPGENAALKASISDAVDGFVTISVELNAEFDEGAYEFKFAATGWSKPEVCAADGNVKVTLAAGNTIIKGVYVSSNEVTDAEEEKDNGMQYFCTWSAE